MFIPWVVSRDQEFAVGSVGPSQCFNVFLIGGDWNRWLIVVNSGFSGWW